MNWSGRRGECGKDYDERRRGDDEKEEASEQTEQTEREMARKRDERELESPLTRAIAVELVVATDYCWTL